MPSTTRHLLLLQWLTLFFAVLFGLYIVWDLGLFQVLLDSDKSRISLIILSVFALAIGLTGIRVAYLSREMERTRELMTTVLQHNRELAIDDKDQLLSRQALLPAGLLNRLLRKHLQVCQQREPQRDVFLQNLEKELFGAHDLGWLTADLMIKLGLLGTVIGFIIMLGSVSAMENVDISTIQRMLVDMSAGMRVALYTTLTGLICGMLLGLQMHFLDRAAQRLLIDISDFVELHTFNTGQD